MFRRAIAVIGALSLLAAVGLGAESAGHPRIVRPDEIVTGGPVPGAKTAVDTFLLMGPSGSGAPYLGDFEAGWNGWSGVDNTVSGGNHWSVGDLGQVVPGELAAWCGDPGLPACPGETADGGYGNNWQEIIFFRTAVADPAAPATVVVSGSLVHDVETAFDFVRLGVRRDGETSYTNLQSWTGEGTAAVADSADYLAGELVGGTDIEVAFIVSSDGEWSDEDCNWLSDAACRLDDLSVTVRQTGQADIVSFTDFQDGTFGDWEIGQATGVGDFAQIWQNLEDLDPCRTNYSAQVAFIDDGVVVPGTGGSLCINWCYGPSGYIVNTTGGLAGPDFHIDNGVVSPAMAWPDAARSGAILAYDLYAHEDLSFDAPGIFHQWHVRSADTDGSAGHGVQTLADQPWVNQNFIIFQGGPAYYNNSWDITDLMVEGRDEVQVQLSVVEYPWFGYTGNDGYPAPYFDNVRVQVFAQQGPVMWADERDLGQDAFPEIDELDAAEPGRMHVRFDAAQNIAVPAAMRNDPGDSLVIRVTPARSGAVLYAPPAMHYLIDPNPVFDTYRSTPTGGVVPGVPVDGGAFPEAQLWAFDLPDTGTLYPGDVLHYYFRAQDVVGADVQAATLPADLAGFGDFAPDPLAFDTRFVVRALPTVRAIFSGRVISQPDVLFWNDVGFRAGPEAWTASLADLGLEYGQRYDVYHTNAASSRVGNGLGGRTAGPSLAGYRAILYTSGDLFHGLEDGSQHAGSDLATLQTWLGYGNKTVLPDDRGLFLTGDNLASSLQFAGGAGAAFCADVLGVDVTAETVRPLISNQAAPLVKSDPGADWTFQTATQWFAYGSCPWPRTFDAVTARPGAVRLAEFCDPIGNTGSYPYTAGTELSLTNITHVISLPYALEAVQDDPGSVNLNGMSDRTALLRDVGYRLGFLFDPGNVPPGAGRDAFTMAAAPNPFNPATRIDYTVRAPGHLVLKVYDVRGRLVRTLVDGPVAGNGFVMWDGADAGGGQAASGVYFVEARMGGDVLIRKVALVK